MQSTRAQAVRNKPLAWLKMQDFNIFEKKKVNKNPQNSPKMTVCLYRPLLGLMFEGRGLFILLGCAATIKGKFRYSLSLLLESQAKIVCERLKREDEFWTFDQTKPELFQHTDATFIWSRNTGFLQLNIEP